MTKIADIQRILGVTPDGIWGPMSQRALDDAKGSATWTHGKASSFADPRDIQAFRLAKEHGATDQQAFAIGDNGIGCWLDDTSEGSGPSCAVTGEDMVRRWGSKLAAKHKQIEVEANGLTVVCTLKDIKGHMNEAVIDLNPDAVRALGLRPPIMVQCAWRWL